MLPSDKAKEIDPEAIIIFHFKFLKKRGGGITGSGAEMMVS